MLDFVLLYFVIIPLMLAPFWVPTLVLIVIPIIKKVRSGTKLHIAMYEVLLKQDPNSTGVPPSLPHRPGGSIHNSSSDFTTNPGYSNVRGNISYHK